jgi:hypothetical protein
MLAGSPIYSSRDAGMPDRMATEYSSIPQVITIRHSSGRNGKDARLSADLDVREQIC